MPEPAGKGLLKNTFILSVVQVVNIVIKVLQNKVAAICLGTAGMGVLGIFNNTIQLLMTGCGLGIPQSAVRDIAAAEGSNDNEKVNRIYAITTRIVLFTSLFGLLTTVALSVFFSTRLFGDKSYTLSFIILSSVVFLQILSEGYLAILKGKQKFVDLAKCTITGAVVGLLITVPVYWWLKESGIILALILIALAQFIYVNIFVRKYKPSKIRIPLRELFKESAPMVKMGISLMIVSFVGVGFNLIVAAIIRHGGSINDVGIYNAGATILTSYFGVLITAMSTDFYPRVSAVYDNNDELKNLVNRQCLLCLALFFPIVVLFVFAAPFFIEFLYTADFIEATEYTDYAMVGTLLIICSNFLGIILLAKQKSRIFLSSVFSQRLFLLFIYYFFYNMWGMRGLGYSYIVTGLSDILLMTIIMKHFFNITLDKRVFFVLSVELIVTVCCMLLKTIEKPYVKYSIGLCVLCLSIVASITILNKYLDINVRKVAANFLMRFKH